MRKDSERLRDILEAIVQIERYAEQGKNAFDQNELIQVWVTYYLQIIGEAARATSSKLRDQYSQVAWVETSALRNLLIHEYFRINVEIMWAIVENDLPNLKRDIEVFCKN